MSQTPKRFYFVDESGQDTAGRIFVVAISVVERDYRDIETACLEFEKVSGKRKLKWHGTASEKRMNFMRLVIEDVRFSGLLCYSTFAHIRRTEFDHYTIEAIANTVQLTNDNVRSSAEIYVDGLTLKKQSEYSQQLRARGLRGVRVHRATDQGHTLIRLADALAGLIRDAIDDDESEAAKVLRRGKRSGVIVEVRG